MEPRRACVLKSKITTHQRRHKNVTSILLPEEAGSGGESPAKKWQAGRGGGRDEPAATSSFTRRDAKGHAKGKAKNKQNHPVFVLFFFHFSKREFLNENGFCEKYYSSAVCQF